MQQEKIKLWLSSLLLLGIFIAVCLVLAGGLIYLLQQGQNTISYQTFSKQPLAYTSFTLIFQGVLTWDPLALILLGFLTLVFSQILRVLLVGFYFWQSSEYLLALASFFIFIILSYSMLWQA